MWRDESAAVFGDRGPSPVTLAQARDHSVGLITGELS